MTALNVNREKTLARWLDIHIMLFCAISYLLGGNTWCIMGVFLWSKQEKTDKWQLFFLMLFDLKTSIEFDLTI